MRSKNFGTYYLGLDIGTNSVGWAVTDVDYNILQFKNKAMWGIHLFDNGNTAEDRRTHRCQRRRLQRRKQRIELLRSLFKEEIEKVDRTFFQRLDESDLHEKDKKLNQKNTLFNDLKFNDKAFHKEYPTIYHLRHKLMNNGSKPDIRLVYLASHHIIKHRGHFLYKGLSGDVPEFNEVFEELMTDVSQYDFDISIIGETKDIEKTLLDERLGLNEKSSKLKFLIEAHGKRETELINLIAGKKVKMSKLFDDDTLKDLSFSVGENDFSEKADEREDILGPERMCTIQLCKQISDWAILFNILGNHKFISEAKEQI